jgi:hypothetical protein
MKKIILSIIIIMCSSGVLLAANCEGTLAKLKPSCNFVGKGVQQMKNFSKNNKTIGKSLENAGVIKKNKTRKTLKQIAEENKTIDQTIKNMKKK